MIQEKLKATNSNEFIIENMVEISKSVRYEREKMVINKGWNENGNIFKSIRRDQAT